MSSSFAFVIIFVFMCCTTSSPESLVTVVFSVPTRLLSNSTANCKTSRVIIASKPLFPPEALTSVLSSALRILALMTGTTPLNIAIKRVTNSIHGLVSHTIR